MVQTQEVSEIQNDSNRSFVADKGKLRKVLIEVLKTRILEYNPQVLQFPHPEFPNRVSSILYKVEEARIEACFTTLWKACGSMYTTEDHEASARCLATNEIQKIALDSPELLTGEEDLSKKKLMILFHFPEHRVQCN
ncbi:hypothetical protein STCU_05607 [Strigomonas culicis]|uniref:Uncharacterized protein n=1 Tax=Strigomonas culicis TaxID=28005 RepID=S9VW34_9TRYP|nr:hypothetical protein STCU_05607 [Strigomonas culicis]|eukprot:EPY27725.1 hypothetical protein STCU_05607 [Strigomonas culicis]